MFYLHRSKIIGLILLFVCIFLATSLQAQRNSYNYLDFKRKPYYFGITLGYNQANFKLFRSSEFILNDSIRTVESVNGPGFNLGIVTNFKIGDNFDLRLLPTLSFAERQIAYRTTEDGFRDRKVESVFVEMPFHVRYKSAPYNDIRLFVIAGVKYGFDVASDARARQADSIVRIAPTDFSVEAGVGAQFFFPYFIFSPEIKFSHGISNVLLFNDDLPESNVLEKVLSRAWTISLHFEG